MTKVFLQLRPSTLAIITNIEKNMDCYRDIRSQRFVCAICKLYFYGSIILCDESKEILSIKDNIKKPITTYGFSSSSSNIYINEFDMMRKQHLC